MENEGLEALKYLKENKRKHWLDNDKSSECLNCIEKELKALKVIVKTLDIRVSMNKMGQCFLEDNHCIYAIPRSTYDLLIEVIK